MLECLVFSPSRILWKFSINVWRRTREQALTFKFVCAWKNKLLKEDGSIIEKTERGWVESEFLFFYLITFSVKMIKINLHSCCQRKSNFHQIKTCFYSVNRSHCGGCNDCLIIHQWCINSFKKSSWKSCKPLRPITKCTSAH